MNSIYGLIIGDALGVPVEFSYREQLDKHPVKTMIGYGTHSQPPGTWSDDSSMVLATMDSIVECNSINYTSLMEKFSLWLYHDRYTATGHVFDVGRTTALAIRKFMTGVPAELCGETTVRSNGNGSLMRMLPIVLFCKHKPTDELLKTVHQVSSLTHRHPISLVGCGIYALIAVNLMKGMNPYHAITSGYETASAYYTKLYAEAFSEYKNIAQLNTLTREQISGSGYIVDTLVASLWCLLNANSFSSAVLTAVNLGRDTDTVGAVTGSLAGIIHKVPIGWIKKLQNLSEINYHVNRFTDCCS